MRLVNLLRGVTLGSAMSLFLALAPAPARADEVQDISKLVSSGQTGPALEKINAYLGTNPKDPQVRFLKGIVLTEQGKQAEAIQIFSALTEEFPELPEPYNNLAVIYASQGQYEKARNALELAIHTHPSYGTAHENLGDVYAKLASRSYDKALQLDKGNTSAQAKLSLIRTLFDKTGAAARAPGAVTLAKATPETPAAAAPAKPADSSHGGEAGKSAEAAKAADKPAAAKDKDPAADAVSDTVQAWAAAWSAKDPDSYLAFYGNDFKTPNGEPRKDWEKLRRERLSKPGPIQVQLSDLNVSFSDKDSAQVSFRQKYSSSNLKAVNQKTLQLRHVGDKWLIVEERVRG